MVNAQIPLSVSGVDTATPMYTAQQQGNENALATEKILQQHYQSLDAREKSRLSSSIIGAVQLKQFLDAGDLAGAESFLTRRRQALQSRMAYGENLDTQETDYALEALKSGNLQELKNGVDGLIAAGQVYGITGGFSNAPSNVKEWTYYNSLSAEDQKRYLNMKRANQTLNLGGTQMVVGPTGAPVASYGVTLRPEDVPENAFAKSAATSKGSQVGQAAGEAAAKLSSMEAQLPRLVAIAEKLGKLSETATYTQAGNLVNSVYREAGLAVPQGAVDKAAYEAVVDNEILPLLRQTFGAQFTAAEGDRLKATLGDVKKSPEEKKAVLSAFIEQKVGQISSLRAQTGHAAQPQSTQKITVTNGTETFLIDQADLEAAMKDGFKLQ